MRFFQIIIKSFLIYLIVFKAQAVSYKQYMDLVDEDMKGLGMNIDVYAPNSFQTGTALENYYLNEKILLLERDAFFQIRANKVKTTEQVADLHHRLKILRNHAGNILFQLIRARQKMKEEGFTKVELPEHKKTIEKLMEECENKADCMAKELDSSHSSLENILLDNLHLSSSIFSQIPHMHMLEVNSIYQWVQLIYLEVFDSQIFLTSREFDVLLNKQKKLIKDVTNSSAVVDKERKYQLALIRNTLKKWKVKVLKRKHDYKDQFREQALKLVKDNQKLMSSLDEIWEENPNLKMWPRRCYFVRKKADCKAYNNLLNKLSSLSRDEFEFLDRSKEKDFPSSFWSKL